ncbi:lytic transglycosylase domain-containing protein [Candidatus Margulisiibacteriota bacterium]
MDLASCIIIIFLTMSIFSTGGQKEDAIAYREKAPDAWEHLEEGTKGHRDKGTEDSQPVDQSTSRLVDQSSGTDKLTTDNCQLLTEPANQLTSQPANQLPTDLSPKAKVIYKHIVTTRKYVPDYEAELIANTIVHYSEAKKVDPFLAAALIERESGFNARAISKHGAKGLGQLMDFNLKSLKINDPFNIEEAVRGTVSYLSYLLKRWKNKSNQTSLALASYLEGPNGIARNNCRWKKSTGKYISDILKTYDKLKQT